jgi:hypothetical protein
VVHEVQGKSDSSWLPATAQMNGSRAAHWVKLNHQCRIPKRWVAFDTESITVKGENESVQEWKSGAAVRWRRGLKRGDNAERAVFRDPLALWTWVDSFCRAGERTIAVAHGLGFDVRIADVFNILPKLGFRLEWCNLDRNVSAMTWRSDHGTLVLCDTFTWLPMPLFKVGNLLDLPKLRMPQPSAPDSVWDAYCGRDADIVYRAVTELVDFIDAEQLGNWQPTGAGMAYSTWRHRFMTHKVLVHDNEDVLAAERAAMHTGRAEAWRHGVQSDGPFYEVDMRSAYTHIAAECELPTKYKFSCGRITLRQYEQLSESYRVLCQVRVNTNVPVAPYDTGDRHIWPTGEFTTWLWDVEVNELLAESAHINVLRAHVYTKAPILGDWAAWVLSTMRGDNIQAGQVVRAWTKHCGRALIGRLSLRVPSWENFGGNPLGVPGISHDVDFKTGKITRMMHVGDTTFAETARAEGHDSLPQITGWIMAECRVRLWQAMRAAQLTNIQHVDTDSVLVNAEGLRLLRDVYGGSFTTLWQIKGAWQALTIYGPRNIRAGRDRKVAGVPKSATEVEPNVFKGEKWHGLASDMTVGRADKVTLTPGKWEVKSSDPRRLSAAGTGGRTVAIRLEAA